MNFVMIIVGLFFVAGVVLAVLERRRGKAFLAHDMRKKAARTDSETYAEGLTSVFHPGSDNHSH